MEAGSFSGGTNSPASPRVTDQAGCYADSAAVGQCDEVVSGDDLFHVLNAADVAGAGPYGDRGASVLGCGPRLRTSAADNERPLEDALRLGDPVTEPPIA